MAAYPYLVQIIWDILNKFVNDWQKEPYKWCSEIDVQAEIVGRINSTYRNIGKDTVVGNYKDALPGFTQNQIWSRACCEPLITYTYKDKNKYNCHPDIVVWDDIDDPNSPPGSNDDSNWPILWVCEIKFDNKDVEGWDVEKMSYLIKQGDAKFACWLNVELKRDNNGLGVDWQNPLQNQKLWILNVKIPKICD
jgi:hypothetical protein